MPKLLVADLSDKVGGIATHQVVVYHSHRVKVTVQSQTDQWILVPLALVQIHVDLTCLCRGQHQITTASSLSSSEDKRLHILHSPVSFTAANASFYSFGFCFFLMTWMPMSRQ